MARQLSYTTVRLGIYNVLLEKFTKDGELPGFFAKAGMGLTAGAVGAICGTPADVALIRMCVDNRLPEAERLGCPFWLFWLIYNYFFWDNREKLKLSEILKF